MAGRIENSMAKNEDISNYIDLLDDDSERGQAAEQLLLSMGSTAVDPLIDVMLAEEGRKAWIAARLLGSFVAPHALDSLFIALRSSNLQIGGAALSSILEYPAEDIAVRLAEALPDAHFVVQQSIVLALQCRGEQQVVNALISGLGAVDSPTMRCAIIKTLGMLGDPQAIPVIEAYVNDADKHTREWAVFALQQLKADY
jgi:HEAT repeat protein